MNKNKSKEKEYKFIGKIQKCVYSLSDFKVYAVDVNTIEYPEIQLNKYHNCSISGDLPELLTGIKYEITATQQETKYGIGYKVINIRREVPKNLYDMKVFLNEILSQKQVETLWSEYPDIVERVKNNRLDDIDLNKLHGIKKYTFNKIKEKIIENYYLSDLITEFQGYLNLSIIKKLYEKYSSVEKLKENLRINPYDCLTDISGIGFKTADSILLEIEKVSKDNINNGKEPIINFTFKLKSSEQRCLAYLLHILKENENNGHTKMNLADLRMLCINSMPECSHHFIAAIKCDKIYYNKITMDVALRRTYKTELYIADIIKNNIINNKNIWNYDIEKYRYVNNTTMTDEQIQTLLNICKYNISILNGCAGSGKSCCVQTIIKMLTDNNKSFLLMSPTGKAAKVLSEYTKEEVKTIHRGLGYNPTEEYPWTFNENNKLETDIVIIDEFSMVDIFLLEKLLNAINFKKTKLLLIGDSYQLPSVGAGNLLHDFIQSKIIPTNTLTQIFRYNEGGLMKIATDVRLCKIYLNKEMKSQLTTFGENKDYTFIDVAPDQISKNVIALYKKLIDKGNHIEDIQILTAKNVGECGTAVLNNMIQKVANPNYGSEICIKSGDTTFYKGDLIIQKINNYHAEIFTENPLNNLFESEESDLLDTKKNTAFVANGESGVIKEISNSCVIINFDGICVKYNRNDMCMVNLGYAITIHKSQGSAFNNIIVCTPQSHSFMLNSNILYVALTRMKKRCFHLGTLQTVNIAIKKKANLERNTFIQQLLKINKI